MNKIEFLEALVVKMRGSFVEIEPNHFVISHLQQNIALKLIARFGGECLIEYRPDTVYDRVTARLEKVKDGA